MFSGYRQLKSVRQRRKRYFKLVDRVFLILFSVGPSPRVSLHPPDAMNAKSKMMLLRYLTKLDRGEPGIPEDGEIDPRWSDVEDRWSDVEDRLTNILLLYISKSFALIHPVSSHNMTEFHLAWRCCPMTTSNPLVHAEESVHFFNWAMRIFMQLS